MTEVVTNCMVQLDLQKQWAKVTAYAESLPTHLTATPEIVSVDCIEASRNRVKIYFRTPASSLNDLVALFTLGGQLSDPAIVKTVTTLRHLWKLLFASVGDDEPVLSKSPNHYASGFVVYFELGVGRETPAPKIYLPVRHYCANDEEVGRAMSQYYRDVGDEAMGERYINGIKSILYVVSCLSWIRLTSARYQFPPTPFCKDWCPRVHWMCRPKEGSTGVSVPQS